MLQNKKIGLFITGGIAAYKMAEFARMLIKLGADVRVVMTQAACQFITPLTMQTLTKHDVLLDVFDEKDPNSVQHIAMAQWCDLAIVAPATANTIAKLANGIADEIVSTVLLASNAPRLIVPAMNDQMWSQAITQANVQRLIDSGATVMEPEVGFLAEGYSARGRLPELSAIVDETIRLIKTSEYQPVLKNKHVLITAGGTIERIDPVRYISNDSSGKMGLALAQTAQWLGAEVTFVCTKRNLPIPKDINVIYVESAEDMLAVCLEQFKTCDYVVMSAAVSDYRVANRSDQKIKKNGIDSALTLNLIENPDILATLGAQKTHQKVIGFAAETENVLANARLKLDKKQADWIVANDVSQEGVGFNGDTNQVTMITHDRPDQPLPLLTKTETALAIWQTICDNS